jgi:hypothetical protein
MHTHCLAIIELFSLRKRTCAKMKIYLEDVNERFDYYLDFQSEDIPTQIMALRFLKQELDRNNTEFGILKRFVNATPLGHWCSRLNLNSVSLKRLLRDRVLKILFEDGLTFVDDKIKYNELTNERQLDSLLVKFDDFLLVGEFFIVEALSVLYDITPSSNQKILRQYKAECEWYYEMVIMNFDFIREITQSLLRSTKLDANAEKRIKKLALLFELVIDQFEHNDDLPSKFLETKEYINLLRDFIHNFDEILSRTSFDNSPRK